MATLGIDCRFAASSSALGRVARELVSHLLATRSEHRLVLFVVSTSETWIHSLPKGWDVSLCETPILHYTFSEQLYFPRLLRASKIDLLFVPHFNVPLLCPVPFVCMVHDLILHSFPGSASYPRQLAYRLLLALTLPRAQHVLTVSNATKSDLIRLYPSIKQIVSVMPLGISSAFFRASDDRIRKVLRHYELRTPFFLYVGSNKVHKNVHMLIDGFLKAQNKTHDLVLVCADAAVSNIARDAGGGRIRVLRSVSDTDLSVLYSAATAFVTATLAEGFCLPIVEALACGCPVLCSDLPVLREVTGGSATFFPVTIGAIKDVLEHAAAKPSHLSPSQLRASGYYTWTNAAAVLNSTLQCALL